MCDKSLCRLIDGNYYAIGDINIENSGDVYLVNGRYIRYSTDRLIYNHTRREYQLKNASVIEGVIGMKEDEFILGYFEKNPLKNIIINTKEGKTLVGINDKCVNLRFREMRSSGAFYHISMKKASEFRQIKDVSRDYKENLPYDSKNILDNYIKKYEAMYNEEPSKNAVNFAKAFGDLSFGLEFETVKGVLPNNKLGILPLIPLRDGSIRGLEYVTIPLQGAKGIQATIDTIKELKKRTTYDESCSMHLHIGNIPRTPEFILALYKLYAYFQEDMFALFPLYKKYNFEVKRKNYSKPFPLNKLDMKMDGYINVADKAQLNRNFAVLFDYLCDRGNFEMYGNDLNKVAYHPADPNGNQKWNIKTR
jgi:hypothetical protein